jgi:hypothetical protein
MPDADKVELLPNKKLGFLYRKSSLKANVISKIALVPEFMAALKSYHGELKDEVIYEILKETTKQMIANKVCYRTALDVMNKVSKAVTGDSFTWRNN